MPSQNVISPDAQSTPRRRRRLTVHLVINGEAVAAGVDDHYRALCGHTYEVRYGIESRSAGAGQRAEWIKCQACEDLRAYEEAFSRSRERGEKALRLARKILEKMGDDL